MATQRDHSRKHDGVQSGDDGAANGGSGLKTQVASYRRKIDSLSRLVASTPCQPSTQAELDRLLADHCLWVESIVTPGSPVKGRRANFAGADLRAFDLSSRNLRGADLSGCDLRGVKLAKADLVLTRLVGANLQGADLSLANLRHADLTGADTGDANLNGALRR